ncbi:MAG: sodium:glutamate symporter [Ruminiclostridium sp.]|nr:sodium:glutamate symporter [Ruminiclostridium sp.]
MENGWGVALYFSGVAACLGLATVLKLKVKLFQKHLMPTAMVAGLIGFIVLQIARYGFGWVSEEKLTQIQHELGYLISHLMAVGFIALALKDRSKKKNKNISNTGFAIVSTYMVQGILGLAVSLALVKFAFPDLFPPFGMLLPLGFAQGSGQAVNVGIKWEEAGFRDGANISLAVANLGLLWALLGGVPYLNFLLKRVYKNQRKYAIHEVKSMEPEKSTQHTSTMPKSVHIDDLSIQLLLIGCVYLLTWLFITGASKLLLPLGVFGETVSELLWGFNFVIGTVIALATRFLMDKLRRKRLIHTNYADNYLLQRISSASFDFMITASLAAISIRVLKEYWVPILVLTTIGGLFTMVYTYYMGRMIYNEDQLEHIVALYGMWTGTITTGVALLREIDPYSRTDVADNLVLGSGVAILLGFPMMFILALPMQAYLTNQPIYYVLAFAAMIIIEIFMLVLLFKNRPGKELRKKA